MSLSQDWGFNLIWSAYYIDNTPPFLSNEEAGKVRQSRDIFFSFEVVWKIDKNWLIDASLNLAPRGMTRISHHFTSPLFIVFNLVIWILYKHESAFLEEEGA